MNKEDGLRCANCFHNGHYDFDENVILAQCRHSGGYYSDYEKCKCNNFRPLDNLDYLEYQYEQSIKTSKI
jgi:hypothetical protein